jgi:serine protease
MMSLNTWRKRCGWSAVIGKSVPLLRLFGRSVRLDSTLATKLYRVFRESGRTLRDGARLNSVLPARRCHAAQAFHWSQTMRHPLLTLAAFCALLAPLTLHAPLVLAATPDTSNAQARVIVKFKAEALSLRKQALSASNTAAQVHTAQAQSLGARTGLALRGGMGVAERTQVMFASGMSSAQLAERLTKDGDVEYAVPDERKRRMAAPNDSLYFSGPPSTGPASGQWYLRPNAGAVKSSIDVESAWAITTGSPSVVVAVLDSGIRFDHPDMQPVSAGGNLLQGYDMISNLGVANDGDGRDGDPSDPGDWVTAAEANLVGGEFYKCTTLDSSGRYTAESSSWHGTQTAGLIGAGTNNGIGMASVGRSVRVLPVRVLGKCGGFDSDIIAGMRWAGGLSVPGVPANLNPARVINLSLGGSGSCTDPLTSGPAYTAAVAELNAKEVVVVASAGNSAGHSVSSPANCPGVIAVAALRHVGTKVGFSDLGSEITVSAPGGNCVNLTGPCVYPILTTTNGGSTVPFAGSSTYTDSFDISLGTSFSAPLVSGTVALMMSARPALSPAEVATLLKGTARSFPTTGGENASIKQCTAPQYDTAGKPIDQDQCYCTTNTCGAGMLDAGAAVTLSTQVVLARIFVSPESPAFDQLITLSASPSLTAPGRSIASYAWTLNDGGGIVTRLNGAANAPSTTVNASGAGAFTVTLTVVDDLGARSTTPVTVNVGGVPVLVGPPVDSGGGAVGGLWLALLALAAMLVYRSRPASNRS